MPRCPPARGALFDLHTPRALGICKQTSCPVLNFSAMAMTASLVIVESPLPVHARSCFIAGPPAASLDPSVQATPAARWEIGAFAYFGRTTGCGQ